MYNLLDASWEMYTSFCDAYEAAGEDLGVLVQKHMAPYCPAYFPGEVSEVQPTLTRLQEQTEENTKLWQALKVFMEHGEQLRIDWEAILHPDYSGRVIFLATNLHISSISKGDKEVMRELWQVWKLENELQGK